MSRQDTISKLEEKTESGELIWKHEHHPHGESWESKVTFDGAIEHTVFYISCVYRQWTTLSIDDHVYATEEDDKYFIERLINEIQKIESDEKQSDLNALEERIENW